MLRGGTFTQQEAHVIGRPTTLSTHCNSAIDYYRHVIMPYNLRDFLKGPNWIVLNSRNKIKFLSILIV